MGGFTTYTWPEIPAYTLEYLIICAHSLHTANTAPCTLKSLHTVPKTGATEDVMYSDSRLSHCFANHPGLRERNADKCVLSTAQCALFNACSTQYTVQYLGSAYHCEWTVSTEALRTVPGTRNCTQLYWVCSTELHFYGVHFIVLNQVCSTELHFFFFFFFFFTAKILYLNSQIYIYIFP